MNGFARTTGRIAISAVILLAGRCRADDARQRTGPMENRFLFVIDTSSAMRPRTNGIVQAVAALLNSDMHGEFRPGDTLGVWTYDEELHADLPMQVWSEENKAVITDNVLRYLRHERFENRAHLEKVLAAVGRVMEQSERLTVIFVYDGSGVIRGTAFDGDINNLQKEHARQFRSAHVPMVTILAARNGQVFDYTINYPGSMVVPHTAVALAPPPQTNEPPAVAVAPLPAPVPAEPSPPRRRIEIIMSGVTNHPPASAPTASATDSPSSAASNIVTVAAAQPQPQPLSSPAPAALAPGPAAPIASNPPPSAPKPDAETAKAAAVRAQPEPAPVVQPAPAIILPNPSALPAPAPASVAAPVSILQQTALFVIAFSLLIIALVLVALLLRRSRGGESASLISQAIDRGR